MNGLQEGQCDPGIGTFRGRRNGSSPGSDGSRGGRCAPRIFVGETGFRTLPVTSINGALREVHPQRLTVRGPVHIPLTPKCTCAQQLAAKKFAAEGNKALIEKGLRRSGQRFMAGLPLRSNGEPNGLESRDSCRVIRDSCKPFAGLVCSSLHFSPPDGRSTRYERQDFVALACRAQRTVQVRLRAPFSSDRLAPRPDGLLTHSASPSGGKSRSVTKPGRSCRRGYRRRH